MRFSSRPVIHPTTSVLLPDTFYEPHLGMDTRNIPSPVVDIVKLQREFILYDRLKRLESNQTHPEDRYQIALLCLEELCDGDELTSTLTMRLTSGRLFQDWFHEKSERTSYFF